MLQSSSTEVLKVSKVCKKVKVELLYCQTKDNLVTQQEMLLIYETKAENCKFNFYWFSVQEQMAKSQARRVK